jgi:hypothetical protein
MKKVSKHLPAGYECIGMEFGRSDGFCMVVDAKVPCLCEKVPRIFLARKPHGETVCCLNEHGRAIDGIARYLPGYNFRIYYAQLGPDGHDYVIDGAEDVDDFFLRDYYTGEMPGFISAPVQIGDPEILRHTVGFLPEMTCEFPLPDSDAAECAPGCFVYGCLKGFPYPLLSLSLFTYPANTGMIYKLCGASVVFDKYMTPEIAKKRTIHILPLHGCKFVCTVADLMITISAQVKVRGWELGYEFDFEKARFRGANNRNGVRPGMASIRGRYGGEYRFFNPPA